MQSTIAPKSQISMRFGFQPVVFKLHTGHFENKNRIYEIWYENKKRVYKI